MNLVYILVPVVAVGFLVFFILLPRYGPHYVSKLTCPNCRRGFNFHWVPGASLTFLRYGSRRRLKCPYCGQINTFDIASTRVSQPKSAQKV
jgi:phage FluMu protein Com